MATILLCAAIIPVIFLCLFIYLKDPHKEPKGLLALIFFMGFVSIIPILIGELVFAAIFPLEAVVPYGLIPIFLNTFFGVALFEEGFKWLITMFFGYKNEAFDEVYDIIVYAVFASLGFACFENIGYVLQSGLGTAFTRALVSIPGHTCFAITMGYFFSKAKIGQLSGNKKIYTKNMILSILVPMVIHSAYDAFLFNASYGTVTVAIASLVPFFILFLIMVVICFIVVQKTANIQQNLSTNLQSGNIVRNDQGILYYNYQNNISNDGNSDSAPSVPSGREIVYCPICGKYVRGSNFCGRCGFKVK